MKTKVPTRRDSTREKTLANKIDCGLNKIPKTLAKNQRKNKTRD
jgi:hypothetical protein